MEIAALHYISQGATPKDHLQNIEKVCREGANWVQLRLKNEEAGVLYKTAVSAKEICKDFGATLIINDHLEIAREMNADGVHLGKEDQCPLIARKLLGDDKIIGGTANTLDDCKSLIQKGVDYIGLGPYRFTDTKKKLSPILGPEGYKKLLLGLTSVERMTPIIAIGGITNNDVLELEDIGIHGVAMSGWLTENEDIKERIHFIRTTMESKKIKNYG